MYRDVFLHHWIQILIVCWLSLTVFKTIISTCWIWLWTQAEPFVNHLMSPDGITTSTVYILCEMLETGVPLSTKHRIWIYSLCLVAFWVFILFCTQGEMLSADPTYPGIITVCMIITLMSVFYEHRLCMFFRGKDRLFFSRSIIRAILAIMGGLSYNLISQQGTETSSDSNRTWFQRVVALFSSNPTPGQATSNDDCVLAGIIMFVIMYVRNLRTPGHTHNSLSDHDCAVVYVALALHAVVADPENDRRTKQFAESVIQTMNCKNLLTEVKTLEGCPELCDIHSFSTNLSRCLNCRTMTTAEISRVKTGFQQCIDEYISVIHQSLCGAARDLYWPLARVHVPQRPVK